MSPRHRRTKPADLDKQLAFQLSLVTSLLKLVSRQEAVLEKGRMGELAILVNAKRALTRELRAWQQITMDLAKQWKTISQRLSSSQQRRFETRINKIRSVAEEIIEKERRAECRLQRTRRLGRALLSRAMAPLDGASLVTEN
jgi:hypothetical protein